MNKILIFAGCKESKKLIEKLYKDYANLGEFHIVYEEDEIKEGFPQKDNFFFYKINFYAYELYKPILLKDLAKIVVFIKNKNVAEFVFNKIKRQKTSILFVKFWDDFVFEPKNNIEILDVTDIITNKIIDFLPNVPLYARDIGLGKGEILEVEVPPYSPFTYKSANIFNKTDAKIVALYRNGELKFVTENTTILPNDKLIIMGNPHTLKELFNQIKSNVGAFPQPYGQDIFLLIDMKCMDKKTVSRLLKSAIFMHKKLKNRKLIIKVINPSTKSQIYKLFKFSTIDVFTDYFEEDYKNALKAELDKNSNIGLIITCWEMFKKYKKTFFKAKKPVFICSKEESVKKCESIGVILNKFIVRIAPVIFDLAFQLEVKIKFFDVDPEEKHKDIEEYLRTISKSFSFAKMEYIHSNDNPVHFLKNEKNMCLVDAFTHKPPSKLKQILFPKTEDSYIMLEKFNHFLLPIKDENES